MRARSSLLAALNLVMGFAALFPLSLQSATNTLRFNYDSRDALLADGWSFVATLPSGVVRDTEITNTQNGTVVSYDQIAHPGILQVPVDVGDLWALANNTRNSLFRALPTNWVSLQFQLSMTVTQNFRQANLTVYQDDDNYVSVAQTFSGASKVTMAREFKGYPLQIVQSLVAPTNVFLRMDRDTVTDNISGLYSLDGTNWISLGVVSQALVNTRLCLWAGGGTMPWTNSMATADFQRLDIITSEAYVAPQPTLILQPQYLVFNGIAGQPLTNFQQVNVVQLRGQDPPLSWTLTNTAPWLQTSTPAGTTPSTCNLSVDTSGLAAGRYDATLSCGAPGATAGVATVTLLLNPPGRARVATWRGASSGAFSLCVDDSYGTGFDDLYTNGLSGTYFGMGFTAPSFYSNYYQAGMELGSHTVDHPCYNELPEPLLRYELERNLAGLCATGGQPCEQYISFAWPCGTASPKMESVAADYFLSSRGYNLNQLEDPSPSDFMNLKSFNTHGDPVPPPVADFKTMVDAAIAQGKWFNMVLHGVLLDDGAIAYSVGKDIWSVSQGTILKYILQRDRAILTNYAEANGSVSFEYYRLPIEPSSRRIFENALLPQDTLTMQVDVTGMPVIYGLTVNGVSNNYTTKIVGGRTLLLWDSLVTTTAQLAAIQGPTNTAPSLPAQSNLVFNVAAPVSVTNTATDPDAGQTLTYSLVNSPAGATIDTTGIINWTPSEAQGSGTYTFTTIVTDNGVPPLSDTNSFLVDILPVRHGPSLQAQTDQTLAELTTLTVTNTATDSDAPPVTLNYQLINPPAGASIDTNGIITWTPTEAQGPSTNVITTVVADNGSPPLSATNSFNVIVQEINLPPVLPAQADVFSSGTAPVVVANTATDPDIPANTLTYVLAQAPVGAQIDTNGIITWVPANDQVPSTNVFQTVVTDYNPWSVNTQHLSATNSFRVIVSAIHNGPILLSAANQTIATLTTLRVTNTALDFDIPALALTYALLDPPSGASIDPNGIITWTPTLAQGPSTNFMITTVTDNGEPPLSASNGFTVTVLAPLRPFQITSITVSNNLATISWEAVSGQSYRVQFTGGLEGGGWNDVTGDITAQGSTANATVSVSPGLDGFYRVSTTQMR